MSYCLEFEDHLTVKKPYQCEVSQGLVWGDHLTTKTKKLSHGIHKVKYVAVNWCHVMSTFKNCITNITLHCILNIASQILYQKFWIVNISCNVNLQTLHCNYCTANIPMLIARWFSLMGFASFNPPRKILLTDVCFLANDFVLDYFDQQLAKHFSFLLLFEFVHL